MAEITQLLEAAAAGDSQAAAQVLPLVYDELHRLAAARMADERADHTLSPTALVHEAYLKLTGEHAFASKPHYLRVAAEAMKRILVDHARRRATAKRGGGLRRIPLDETARWTESPDHLLALQEALARFTAKDPRKAELVELRFFAGMTTAEAAQALGVSIPTAERWWTFARAWLSAELDENSLGSP